MNSSSSLPTSSSRRRALPWRYRAAVVSRLLAAIAGGYVLASALGVAAAALLPRLGIARSEAVVGAAMLAYLTYAVTFIGCFRCVRAVHAWLGTLTAAAALAAPFVVVKLTQAT